MFSERRLPVTPKEKYVPKEVPPHLRAYNRYTSRTVVGLGVEDYEKIERNEDILTLPRSEISTDLAYQASEANALVGRLKMDVRVNSYTVRTEVRLCSEMLDAIQLDTALPLEIRQEGLRQIQERLNWLEESILLMGDERAWNERGQQFYAALEDAAEKSGQTVKEVLAAEKHPSLSATIPVVDLSRKESAELTDPAAMARARAMALAHPPYTDLWLHKNHPECF